MADEQPHLPPPSLWPVGFAIGVAVLLVGLVINPKIIAPIGALMAIVFGFLWVREMGHQARSGPPVEVEPETREVAAQAAPPPAAEAVAAEAEAPPAAEEAEEEERFPRSKFLEGATIGVGAVIGGMVAVPAI